MTEHRVALPRWAGVLIVVMAAVTLGQTAWYSSEQQACNEAFARDREAMQAFWKAVYEHPKDRAENMRLFGDWVHTFKGADDCE